MTDKIQCIDCKGLYNPENVEVMPNNGFDYKGGHYFICKTCMACRILYGEPDG